VFVGLTLGVFVASWVAVTVGVSLGVTVGPVGVTVGSGRGGARFKPNAAERTLFAAKQGAVDLLLLMPNAPDPAAKSKPARLVSYTNTIARPRGSGNPSLGAGAQMNVSTLTSAGLLHTGGSPAAGRPNAKTLRMIPISQSADTPVATHAGGTVSPLKSSGTRLSMR